MPFDYIKRPILGVKAPTWSTTIYLLLRRKKKKKTYQIKILICSQAKKDFKKKKIKKKLLSCYQIENKHATLEKIILKLFKNKNFTKTKEKDRNPIKFINS